MNSFLTKVIARLEDYSCRIGVLRPMTWDQLRERQEVFLYAGDLRRNDPQYVTHFGLTPFRLSPRTIYADVTDPIPLPDQSVDSYQSEDVFEHITYDELVPVFDEIYRVLKPGGLFRLSVPDYRCDICAERALRNAHGEIVFDPGGGGRYENGVVSAGGHQWFPVWESVEELFRKSLFWRTGKISFLHGFKADGTVLLNEIDHSKGPVRRTPDFDSRVSAPRRPLSIVVDAYKNGGT